MDNKIKVGITHGDINGIGYELVLKTFSEEGMLDMCTPIIYGSPRTAAYHQKALGMDIPFHVINNAKEAVDGKLNLLAVYNDEVNVKPCHFWEIT